VSSFVAVGLIGPGPYIGATGLLQIPVSRRRTHWLQLIGGGTYDAAWWQEIALRISVRGNGTWGSTYITPGIGVGALYHVAGLGFMPGLRVEIRPNLRPARLPAPRRRPERWTRETARAQ